MNYVIFDLEATCWEGWDKSQNETIEIGAVLINEDKKNISEFQQFVKPLKHPILSEFCKNLTTINQEEVDNAPFFSEAIDKFKDWFKCESENYLLFSWGIYDKIQFESDCQIYGLDSTWVSKHINLKQQYAEFKKLKRSIGMKNALILENLEIEGTHHRGIDDARNIGKIFIKYFEKWKY